ncbi:MAG: sugar phosphate isomerase/epimerase family protein [Mycobacteriales bacterium]
MQFAVFTASLPEWSPQEAVQEIADAGYDGVEWRVTDQPPVTKHASGFWSGNRCTWPLSSFADDVPAIRALSESAGLGMPSIGSYVRCNEPEQVDYVLGAVSALGVPQVRISLPGYDDDRPWRTQWDAARKDYETVEQLAKKHGVKALAEIHHRTVSFSPHAARRFVDGRDPAHVGVIHDIGNMVYEGWTPYRMGLEILEDYLAHVHVKSGRWLPGDPRPDGTVGWAATWAAMRTGQVDFVQLFEALRTVGYDGWVSIEDFATELPLAERIRDNVKLLHAVSGRG